MKIKLVYSVPENCKASADLMMPDGSFIRNLYNHKQLYANRTYTEYYDDVNNLAAGQYKLRLTTNNILSYWEVVIGNNSAKSSGKTRFYNMEQAEDMDAGTTHYYYACKYNEGKTSCMRIPRNNLRVNEHVFPQRGMNASSVCVKNGIVYWGGVDAYKKATYADEFAERFIDELQPLKQACEGMGDEYRTEERIRKCVHIYIDADDKFAGYRQPDYTKQKFIDWFNQYVFRADWSFNFSGVWATRETDNSEVEFTFGREYTPYIGRTYKSMIGIYEDEQAEITGLAVSDEFIYIAYGGQSNVWFWNSRNIITVLTLDGREVNKIEVPKPGKMIIVDNYLFFGSGNNVCRANLDRAGGIDINKEIPIGGTFTVMDVSYYKGTDTLAVIATDGIVHYFDKELNLRKECGNKEMYWEKPQVYNDKFYWEDTRQTYEAFICTDPITGLQLIGDGGNNRIQVFDRNFVYKSTICWVSTNYSVNVINDDPTRIFCYYLEFNRDYTNPKALKWKLVNNWGCYAVNEWQYCDMPFVLHGKTYAKQQSYSYNKIRLIELNPDTGLVPLNEVTFPNSITKSRIQIYPDGCIYRDELKQGYYLRVSRQNLIGIKEDGFFEWATPVIIVNTNTPPEGSTFNNMSRRVYETIGDNYYVFNAHRTELGNHLSSIRISDGEFIQNGFPSDHPDYWGEYMDDVFPVGNGVVYPGGQYVVCGEFIICNVHGEFWGAGQTNKWHLFDKDLVALHTYGTEIKTIKKQGIEHPAARMAGNSFSGNLVKQGNYYYLYHCDEGHHGGVHSVRFEGMDTVKRQEFTATVLEMTDNPSIVYPLALLPKVSRLKNGDGGWNMQPEEEYRIDNNDYFSAKVGSKYLSKIEPSDLQVNFRGIRKLISVWYNIDGISLTRWTFTGMINFEGNYHSRDNGNSSASKFQLVNDSNEVLFEMWTSINYSTKEVTLHVNDKIVFTLVDTNAEKILDYFRNFTIWYANSVLYVKYHSYPAIALGTLSTKPAQIRILMFNNGTISSDNSMSLIRLKFNKR